MTPLRVALEAPKDVSAVVKKALGLLEAELSRLAPGGRITVTAHVETDAELPGWKYAVITVEVAGDQQGLSRRSEAEDSLIEAVYSRLTPEEATKVVVVFHHVQSP